MHDSEKLPFTQIDTAVDVDGRFSYDDSLSPEENYIIWLGFIYDTFAGITNGDNYVELVEQFADDVVVAVKINKGSFSSIDGLPARVLDILKDPVRTAEDLVANQYTLDITAGLHILPDKPSKVRIDISSCVSPAEIEIFKPGEDADEPIDIMFNGALVGTISQMHLLNLLISLHKDSGAMAAKGKDLSVQEIDNGYQLLLSTLGEQQGFANTEYRIYGDVEPEIRKEDPAKGGIIVRYLDSPDESIMHIDMIHHEVLENLDSDIIYRLHSELEHTQSDPSQGSETNVPEAQKIINSPVGFSIRNLGVSIEQAGIIKEIPIDKEYMVLMIKVVQEILGQISGEKKREPRTRQESL